MEIKGIPFYWFAKGATSYEAQFGRIVIRLCHLQGEYWRWRPWRRVSVKWWPKSDLAQTYSKISYDGGNFVRRFIDHLKD